MDILKSLSQIVNFDLSKLKNFHLNILSNNTSSVVVKNDNRVVNINISSLDEKNVELLKKILPELVHTEGTVLMEKSAKENFDTIAKLEKTKTVQDLLTFFRGKLVPGDLEMLRASIFIKSEHEKGREVQQFLRDVEMKYGRRGRVISNLYSAGYFDSVIRPLYEQMEEDPDFSLDQFRRRFSTIVREHAFAVFVSKISSLQEIESEVRRKIELNKRYGIHKLNIHGIGNDNAEKIHAVLLNLKAEGICSPEIESSQGHINARVFF